MKFEVKIDDKNKWIDLYVEGEYIGFIYADEEGKLVVHICKDKVKQVTTS